MSAEREPRAWVLNLDAEHELEAGRGYAPTNHLRELVARESRRLVGTLVGPEDVVLAEEPSPSDERARGLLGFAWCPTPRAIARLEAAGAIPIQIPGADVIRRVNVRPFAIDVRAPLVERSFEKHVVHELEGALEHLAGDTNATAPLGWLVRRTFGAAGRGRRRIARGRPDAGELAWLNASLRRGPLVIEPWVEVTREFTRSAWVQSDGEVVIAAPCFQETTEHGAWAFTERAERGAVSRGDDDRLLEATERAGRALAAAGYFGPFGIDAFRHRDPLRPGAPDVLNPMSEINARFTMDWTTGMAARPEGGQARTRLDELARPPSSTSSP